MKKSPRVAFCSPRPALVAAALALLSSISASAATIVAQLTQSIGTASDATGIGWRNASINKGSADIDGDNIFGTQAYYLAKTTWGAGNTENFATSNFNKDHMTFLDVSWLTVSAAAPTTNYQANFSTGFKAYQNPTEPAGKMSVGVMGRYYSGGLVADQFGSLYNFTFGAGVPDTIAITIAVSGDFAQASATGLQLVQTAGTGSGNSASFASLATLTNVQHAAFSTFILTGVQPGDVFRLDGRSSTTNGVLINGIMIDSLITVPEPSAFAALAGLGALGFSVMRRRRR